MIERFGLIVGAMKCGTTSLYEYVAQHPEIAPCVEKEPNFFAPRDGGVGSIEAYESLWDWRPERHELALDGSTHYTKVPEFPDAAEQIAQVDRDFRFVYLVRNPVDRIESHITHGLSEGWLEPGEPIQKRRDALAITRYASQLERYERYFDRDRILVVNFLDLVDDPESVVGDVFDHFDLPHFEVDTDRSHNSMTDRLRVGKQLLPMLGEMLPREASAELTSRLGKPAGRYELDDREAAFVLRELREDLKKLRRRWRIEVERWRGVEL
jgi:hypothetical protein